MIYNSKKKHIQTECFNPTDTMKKPVFYNDSQAFRVYTYE